MRKRRNTEISQLSMNNFRSALLVLCALAAIDTSCAQVVINEVMHAPGPNLNTNQGLKRKEYVEIYNPSCSPVDIGCWIIGMSMYGGLGNYIGSFQFPSGTVIGSNQHLVMGGTTSQNSTSYPSASIDFDVSGAALSSFVCDPNARWLMPNTVGMVALYDPTGAVKDAIYWGSAANVITTDTDFDSGLNPCKPSGAGNTCPSISGKLLNAKEIYTSTPNLINYVGAGTSSDKTFSRIPDGGTWQRNINPSITGSNCNNGQCSSSQSFNLTATSVNPNCGAADGSITFTNPPPNYQFVWTPNVSNSASAAGLSAGTPYKIEITSPNGCKKDTTITLSTSNGITNVNVTSTNPDCGQSNGTITVGTITGGATPYTFSWTGSGGYTSNIEDLTSLAAGTYSVTVKDGNSCTFTPPNITLASASGPTDITVTTTPSSCTVNDGEVTLGLVTGGSGTYEYSLEISSSTNTSYSATKVYPNLAPGSYTVSVRDLVGQCVYTKAVQILSANGPTAVQVNVTPEYCGKDNGTISVVNVTGGIIPFEFDLNNLGYSTSKIYSALSSGSYSLAVRDKNGCIFNAPAVSINEVAGPTNTNVNIVNATCGGNNGSIIIQGTTGGTTPYTYNFNNQGDGTEDEFTNLTDGSYTLTVTDLQGCTLSAGPYVVTNSSVPTSVTANVTNATCQGNDGKLDLVNVQNGTSPYQFSLNNGAFQTSGTYSNLIPGDYTVKVQDALGCTYTPPVVALGGVSGPTSIELSITDALCGEKNGKITIASVTGGTSPFEYSINGSPYSGQLVFDGLGSGVYSIATKDAQGCVYQVKPSVAGGTAPEADFNISPTSISIFNPYAELVNISTEDVVSFEWTIVNGSPSVSTLESPKVSYENIDPGSYPITLIVRNSDGCPDTITKTIEIYDEFTLFAPNAFTPDGDEFNNVWNVFVNNADLESFDLQIYNRWGELLFNSKDPSVGWDGTIDGFIVQDGVYSWKLRIKDVRTDKIYSFSGHITKTQ